jgi:CRISPR/Cas system-associated exonuclease Cas4 (RecB family)
MQTHNSERAANSTAPCARANPSRAKKADSAPNLLPGRVGERLGRFRGAGEKNWRIHLEQSKPQLSRPKEGLWSVNRHTVRDRYQATFLVRHKIAGTDVEIVGAPDFQIFDGDGYMIRDCKLSRRIEAEIHPEIVVQIQLYGWLFERSTGLPAKGLQVYNGMKEIVGVEDDGGEWALAVLENLLRLKQLDGEPYEPVGWSKCGGCGFNGRCMDKAEADGSVALVPDVDQNLALYHRCPTHRHCRSCASRYSAAQAVFHHRRKFGELRKAIALTKK